MAEVVQKHMESMVIEISSMIRSKLYTKRETKCILKTRKEFEYKVNGAKKNLQDFLDYIAYEKLLLRQTHLRRDKHRISIAKSTIDHRIRRRIKNLYEIALSKYSTDVPLYLAFLKFCSVSKYLMEGSLAVQRMLKNCFQVPEIWQVATRWYANEGKNITSALQTIRKGISIHKGNHLLINQAIQLEKSQLEDDNEELKAKIMRKIETYESLKA